MHENWISVEQLRFVLPNYIWSSLRDSEYINFELKFNKASTNETKRNRQGTIIWFNLPFNRAVSTNVGKSFCNYYVMTYHPWASVTKYLRRTQWRWANVADKIYPASSNWIIWGWIIHLWKIICHVIAGRSMSVPQMVNAELKILFTNVLPQ